MGYRKLIGKGIILLDRINRMLQDLFILFLFPEEREKPQSPAVTFSSYKSIISENTPTFFNNQHPEQTLLELVKV
jgi:hypothetical protein